MKFVCVQCGNCCRILAFPIGHEIVSPKVQAKMKFYTARGLKIHWTDGNETLWATIPHKCRNLSEDNRCYIYKSRPEICRKSIGLRYSFVKCEGYYEEDQPKLPEGDSKDHV